MRPAGEIRRTLADQLDAVAPITSRELAKRTLTGFEATRRTLGNMVRDGAARVHDYARVPGVRRPVPRYAPVPAAERAANDPQAVLALWPAMA